MNCYLKDIMKFRLDYCVLKQLPKKNWISENHVGLARILPFVIGQYFLYFDPEKRVETTSDHVIWLKRLVNSLHVMIALLMTKEKVDTVKMDAHIKIFLTCCHRFSKLVGVEEAAGFWESKGNFYSLLNLPAQIELFSILRWYWDGK